MRNFRWMVLALFFGALAFWGANLVIFTMVPTSGRWILQSIVCPISFIVGYFILKSARSTQEGASLAAYMLLGVWLGGVLGMEIAAFAGGTSFRDDLGDPRFWAYSLFLSLVPPFTLWMAAFHGAGYGLLAVTIIAVILHKRYEAKNWILPWKRRNERRG